MRTSTLWLKACSVLAMLLALLLCAPVLTDVSVVVETQAWEPVAKSSLAETARVAAVDTLTKTALVRFRTDASESAEMLLRIEVRLVEESETLFMLVGLAPAAAGAAPSFAANGFVVLGGLSAKVMLDKVRVLAAELSEKTGNALRTDLGDWLKGPKPMPLPSVSVALPAAQAATAPHAFASVASRQALGRCVLDEPDTNKRFDCAQMLRFAAGRFPMLQDYVFAALLKENVQRIRLLLLQASADCDDDALPLAGQVWLSLLARCNVLAQDELLLTARLVKAAGEPPNLDAALSACLLTEGLAGKTVALGMVVLLPPQRAAHVLAPYVLRDGLVLRNNASSDMIALWGEAFTVMTMGKRALDGGTESTVVKLVNEGLREDVRSTAMVGLGERAPVSAQNTGLLLRVIARAGSATIATGARRGLLAVAGRSPEQKRVIVSALNEQLRADDYPKYDQNARQRLQTAVEELGQ